MSSPAIIRDARLKNLLDYWETKRRGRPKIGRAHV